LELEIILKELRIRLFWILICFSLTWLTSYWLSEEFIFLLAKSLIILLYPDSFFICAQLTEAFNTYVTMSLISCFYFFSPFLGYQIRCFLMPSCYEGRRERYKKLLYGGGFCFLLFLSVTFVWVVPYAWHFFQLLSTTSSTDLLMIKLQPKIFDYILLTVRILFISSICSQIPLIVICLLESIGFPVVRTLIRNRHFFLVALLLIATLCSPPDIWCQIFACFLTFVLIESTVLVALIIQVSKKQLSG